MLPIQQQQSTIQQRRVTTTMTILNLCRCDDVCVEAKDDASSSEPIREQR
jgi:hypothetical protein